MIVCPICKEEIDDDSHYCDQLTTPTTVTSVDKRCFSVSSVGVSA